MQADSAAIAGGRKAQGSRCGAPHVRLRADGAHDGAEGAPQARPLLRRRCRLRRPQGQLPHGSQLHSSRRCAACLQALRPMTRRCVSVRLLTKQACRQRAVCNPSLPQLVSRPQAWLVLRQYNMHFRTWYMGGSRAQSLPAGHTELRLSWQRPRRCRRCPVMVPQRRRTPCRQCAPAAAAPSRPRGWATSKHYRPPCRAAPQEGFRRQRAES